MISNRGIFMNIVNVCSEELTRDWTSHINLYLHGGFKIHVEKSDELIEKDEFLFISKKYGEKESFVRLDSIVNFEIVRFDRSN